MDYQQFDMFAANKVPSCPVHSQGPRKSGGAQAADLTPSDWVQHSDTVPSSGDITTPAAVPSSGDITTPAAVPSSKKRSFADCSEEENSSSQPTTQPNKRRKVSTERKKRVVFSDSQLTQLEARFTRQSFLSREERLQLASDLGLTDRQVMIWFQNRRCRFKKLGSADAAYNPLKHDELKTRRPYPFLSITPNPETSSWITPQPPAAGLGPWTHTDRVSPVGPYGGPHLGSDGTVSPTISSTGHSACSTPPDLVSITPPDLVSSTSPDLVSITPPHSTQTVGTPWNWSAMTGPVAGDFNSAHTWSNAPTQQTGSWHHGQHGHHKIKSESGYFHKTEVAFPGYPSDPTYPALSACTAWSSNDYSFSSQSSYNLGNMCGIPGHFAPAQGQTFPCRGAGHMPATGQQYYFGHQDV